jgi:hypothetical protein
MVKKTLPVVAVTEAMGVGVGFFAARDRTVCGSPRATFLLEASAAVGAATGSALRIRLGVQ